MPDKLILFPCNGNAIEALDCIDPDQWEVIGFVDDSPEKIGTTVAGIRVFERAFLTQQSEAKVLAVPGSPASYTIRDQIIKALEVDDSRWATVIHPSASVSNYCQVGRNCLIMEGVVLKANSTIGDHVCMLPNSVLHHDSRIGDYTLIGSGVVIAGYTTLGQRCYIGSRSSIINSISIGDRTLVGIGSNVVKSIPSDSKVVGNPAKSLLE